MIPVSTGWTREVTHDLTTSYGENEWTVDSTVPTRTVDTASTGWRVTATPSTRRSSMDLDGPIPLQQTVRDRSELPSLRVNDHLDDARSHETAVVRRTRPVDSEHLAVLALGVCGDVPPRRASPLVVTVRRVRRHGDSGSVDGLRGASGRPREPATGSSVPPVTDDRGRPTNQWQHRRVDG